MSTNESQKYFLSRFNDAKIKTIPYHKSWANNGYFDFAINGDDSVKLNPTEMAKAISDDGRKMIFVGTQLGTIVVFERYANVDSIIVSNMSTRLRSTGLLHTGTLKLPDLEKVLCTTANIGDLIIQIARAFGIETNITSDRVISSKLDVKCFSETLGSIALDTEIEFKLYNVWEDDFGDIFLEHKVAGNTFKVTKEGFGEPTISFYD